MAKAHKKGTGSRSKYQMGCKCDECRKHNSIYVYAAYKRTHGAKRLRVKVTRDVLVKLLKRFSLRVLSEVMGVSRVTLYRIASNRRKWVRVERARKVDTMREKKAA